MRRDVLLAFVFAVMTLSALPALAGEIQGTTADELKKAALAAPSTIKVAVLPLQDAKSVERHTQVATAAVALGFMRCGFQFAPELQTREAAGLAALLHATDQAVLADKKIAPGEPLRLEDAVRIGQSLGADWVVYGDVVDMHTYMKTGFFVNQKKGVVNLKIKVANVATGELIMSRQLEESGSGGGVSAVVFRRATALERTICTRCAVTIYRDLCAALPSHTHTPEAEPTEDEVMAVEEAWAKLDPRAEEE
jgi:curli biogenesis system outer membrane secretion channel CsgG